MPTRRLLSAAVLLSTALTIPIVGGTASPAQAEPSGDDRVEAARSERVAAAAERYDLSGAEVRAQLAADPTMRLAGNGMLYVVDPAPAEQPRAAQAGEAPFPLSQTFQLHSNEGSQRTIYLDFDGHYVGGTEWNDPTIADLADGDHPAWDPGFDGDAFSAGERETIQDIWQRVAEDFAPFDVDVTTEEPPATAIDKANPADQVYGTRALITPSEEAHDGICGAGGCGGVAFLEAFDMYGGKDPAFPEDTHAALQPAWVFPHTLSDDPKSVAEAITHEVGHNLGLEHDGTTSEGYYTGHGGWAPIMGVGYEQPIVQWSLSDYPGAKLGGPGDESGTWQDFPSDVQTMAAHGAAERGDDAANATVGAGPVPPPDPQLGSTGIIGSRTDVDVFALGSCTGTLSISADPAAVSPNLDIELELLGGTGNVVDSDDPASDWDFWDVDVATGLDAAVSTNGASGNYFVRIDGVGRGAPGNGSGYTDYGSIGAYTLDVTGSCQPAEEPTGEAPTEPENLAASQVGDGTVELTWDVPSDDGGTAITGYNVYEDGTKVRSLGGSARSVQITGLPSGAHSFSVAAVNAAGEGALAQVTVTVTGGDPGGDVPGTPDLGTPKAGKKGKPFTAVFPWRAPAADPAIERYEIVAYRKTTNGWVEDVSGEAPADWTGVKITNRRKAWTMRVEVRACNSLGCGDWATSGAVRLR